MTGVIEQKLTAQGIVLHEPASPVANYVGFVRTGNLLVVSGQVCFDGAGKLVAQGKLGADVSIEQGNAAARACAINLLAQLKAALGRVRCEFSESLSFVIPGRREAASPESITTVGEYGFRARAKRRAPE